MTKYRTIVADPPWPIGDFPEWGEAKGTIACPYPTMSLEAISELPVGSLAAPEAHLYLWTTTEFLRATYGIAESWGFEVMYPLVWCKPPRGQGLGGKFASNVEFILFCRNRGAAKEVADAIRSAAEEAGVTTGEINRRMGFAAMAMWWLGKAAGGAARIPTWDQWLQLKTFLPIGDEHDETVRLVNEERGSKAKCDTRWWEWPRGKHSAKPEAFLDLVEQMSPAPRVELFARRDRLGWDTWGNESLGTAEMAA